MKKHVFSSMMLLFSIWSPKAFSQQDFVLASADLGEFFSLDQVYDKFDCGGRNISPELHWANAPAGTKSFAITMFDPDAPTGKGWWHWLVFDIPLDISALPAGAGSVNPQYLPLPAIQSINDYKEYGYGGPCPPPGKPHRYFITVYALDVYRLGLDKDTPPEVVYKQIMKHTIENAEIMSLYGR